MEEETADDISAVAFVNRRIMLHEDFPSFPVFMRGTDINAQYDHPHTLSRYAEIADYLGLGGKSDEEKLENLIRAINDLKARVGIKETIRDYGIDEADFLARLDDMVEQAFDDQCTGANPRYPLMSEIKQMYLNAYYGNHFVEEAMPSDQNRA